MSDDIEVHPLAAIWPMLNEDECGETGYSTLGGTGHVSTRVLYEVSPSDLAGYWHVSTLTTEAVQFFGRPVATRGVELVLNHLGLPHASSQTWKSYAASPSRFNPRSGMSEKAKCDDSDVYLIQSVAGGLVKIGVAGNVEGRLAALQRMNPVRLRVIGTIPGGGYELESSLHKRFVEQRSHGEWFYLSDEMISTVLSPETT